MTKEEVKAMLPVLQAFADGKAIQSRCIKGDKSLWYDDEDPSFDEDFEYRIKPEPTYRPFVNAEECLAEMQKHQPLGWVKTKDNTYRLINLVGEGRIMLGCQNIDWSYERLFNDFKFYDDAPFGVKVEE